MYVKRERERERERERDRERRESEEEKMRELQAQLITSSSLFSSESYIRTCTQRFRLKFRARLSFFLADIVLISDATTNPETMSNPVKAVRTSTPGPAAGSWQVIQLPFKDGTYPSAHLVQNGLRSGGFSRVGSHLQFVAVVVVGNLVEPWALLGTPLVVMLLVSEVMLETVS